ncbi:MAG TPA: hypothetical protein PKC76_18935 [Saprospiraceae bacterium]|nr:hypothetical protein [Saprospiraceae bacterium]HMP26212.1 hypothetical protein [Saprospiraceae bacterium]
MKKDIPIHKVEDLAIAIVPREDFIPNDEEELWDVYLLNLREEPIKSVLINSRGYGDLNGEMRRTTVLRHFFEEIGPLACVQIEPIQAKLFNLTNEYWVSFVHEDYMYDKKYIFVQGSIEESHFTTIPFLQRKGVMIR